MNINIDGVPGSGFTSGSKKKKTEEEYNFLMWAKIFESYVIYLKEKRMNLFCMKVNKV